jgi:amidohydrolase
VRGKIETMARATAEAFAVEAEVERIDGYPVLVNDADACDRVEVALAGSGLVADRAVRPSLGGEDFAYYAERIPGAFLFLGARDEARGIVHFCHHPRFVVDEAAMRNGVEVWLRLATA